MTYFNYHAKAKNLIVTGHLIKAEIVNKHNKICPALVLYFDCHPPMPIREYRWLEYFVLLSKFNIEIKNRWPPISEIIYFRCWKNLNTLNSNIKPYT